MKITRCKLSKNVQRKLLEYFILEVTARSAADLLGVNPNSAAIFYRKSGRSSHGISRKRRSKSLDGPVELDESYFVGR